MPVYRGTYSIKENYYAYNEVTSYGMMFMAKEGTLENPLSGYAPTEIVEGKVRLVNTDKWMLTAGSPEIYNEAKTLKEAQEKMAEMMALYRSLTQSEKVIGPLPSTGEKDIIYRVPGENYYSDYMWYNGEFILLTIYSVYNFIMMSEAEYQRHPEFFADKIVLTYDSEEPVTDEELDIESHTVRLAFIDGNVVMTRGTINNNTLNI